ncbi:hypothetical protein KKH23_10535 [Patescibacteria group bacterium]|nr:hypothetical protein [Patescibacteria group bacterium]
MAKLPWYLKGVKTSNTPTRLDPVGCNGLFIKSVDLSKWAMSYLLLKILWKTVTIRSWKWLELQQQK